MQQTHGMVANTTTGAWIMVPDNDAGDSTSTRQQLASSRVGSSEEETHGINGFGAEQGLAQRQQLVHKWISMLPRVQPSACASDVT